MPGASATLLSLIAPLPAISRPAKRAALAHLHDGGESLWGKRLLEPSFDRGEESAHGGAAHGLLRIHSRGGGKPRRKGRAVREGESSEERGKGLGRREKATACQGSI